MLPKPPRGRINPLYLLLLAAAAICMLLAGMLWKGTQPDRRARQLTMYCAAGMRVPVMEIARQYEAECGVHVVLNCEGSNTLLNKLQIDKNSQVDLYLAADSFYTDKARELGLAEETMDIAYMRPVIAVRKQRRDQFQTIADLLRPGTRIALANPDAAAVGRATRAALQQVKVDGGTFWDQLKAHVEKDGVFKPTVNEVALDVKLGAADAGIVYDSTVAMPNYREELVAIPVPELESQTNLVSLAVLKSSPSPTAALQFGRYLTAKDRGLPVFKQFGFRPVEGDKWALRPEVIFYCGSVNRHVVGPIVERFAEREGIDLRPVYNGCGILTGTMQNILKKSSNSAFPDMYMACDVYYLENVKQWFQDTAYVSDLELVLVVPKGNPAVQELADLVKPETRVAVGQPDKCTLGVLTRQLLEQEGLLEAFQTKQASGESLVVEFTSSANVVPAVETGSVDATIAYLSDVLKSERVEYKRIASKKNLAVQPFSIAKTSPYKNLARRFYRQLISDPRAFEQVGFHFRLDPTDAQRDRQTEAAPATRTDPDSTISKVASP